MIIYEIGGKKNENFCLKEKQKKWLTKCINYESVPMTTVSFKIEMNHIFISNHNLISQWSGSVHT